MQRERATETQETEFWNFGIFTVGEGVVEILKFLQGDYLKK